MPHATINGASLYYETHGDGPPVILHHGYTGSHVNWEPVVPLLKGDYRTILMDCRGAGDSEHTEGGYNIEQYAADVVGVADYLGLGQFTFVGHSMG
ncbi:MAG: alpha/beta hydrolase, partial [Dehalococcoidia bacterium]